MSSKSTIPYGRAGLNAAYGNPTGPDGKRSAAWERANIIALPLPWPKPYNKMRLAWGAKGAVYKLAIHKAVADDLTAILIEIWNEARRRVKKADPREDASVTTAEYDKLTMAYLRKYGLDVYGGAYNYRLKRGGSSLSVHSFGAAIDIDPANNGMGDTTPAMPLWVIEIFEARGWVAGYRWKGKRIDAMHFQRCRGY